MADPTDETTNTFEDEARRAGKGAGVVKEFGYLVVRTRKWWMAPILLALFMVAALLVMGGTAAGPLIYALF